MIDEYWTWQFYGYHSDELAECSHKPIVALCDDCCQYRVLAKDGYRDLCRACAATGENNGHYGENTKLSVKCDNCGRRIDIIPYYSSHYEHHFCNNACQREFFVGQDAPNYISGKEEVVCDNCGNSIFRCLSSIRKRNFCDRECYYEFRYGKGEYLYRHTDERRQNHSNHMKMFYSDNVNREKHSASLQGVSYDEWEGFAEDQLYCPDFDNVCRESNREKYDRLCFLCGKDETENITSSNKCRKLAVHHYDMNKMTGCDDHVWKLVPLCMSCHGSAHSKTWMARIEYLLRCVWNSG